MTPAANVGACCLTNASHVGFSDCSTRCNFDVSVVSDAAATIEGDE